MWFNNTPTTALGAEEIGKWNSTNKGGHCEGGNTNRRAYVEVDARRI